VYGVDSCECESPVDLAVRNDYSTSGGVGNQAGNGSTLFEHKDIA
jgi:hypothetical protein